MLQRTVRFNSSHYRPRYTSTWRSSCRFSVYHVACSVGIAHQHAAKASANSPPGLGKGDRVPRFESHHITKFNKIQLILTNFYGKILTSHHSLFFVSLGKHKNNPRLRGPKPLKPPPRLVCYVPDKSYFVLAGFQARCSDGAATASIGGATPGPAGLQSCAPTGNAVPR